MKKNIKKSSEKIKKNMKINSENKKVSKNSKNKKVNKNNKFTNFIKKYNKPITFAIASLLILLFGSLSVGFIPSLLILIIIGLLYYFLTKPKKKKEKYSFIKSLFIFGFTFTTLLLIMGCSFIGYIVITAPKFSEEKLYNKDASILYMANGEEYAKLGKEIRQKITYDEISQSLIDAIVATEDSRFFQHNGVDLPRFIKASFNQLLGKGGGGASTLTMQVSKNAFTSNVDTGIKGIIRKFTDIYVSMFEIETHYTKEQIFEFYVNSNNLGSHNRGVEQASQDFFGKSASELNVAEAALVAGVFQAPNGYYPYAHPEECENRRQTVLKLMLRHGYINEEEYEIAKELSVSKLLNKKEDDLNTDLYQDFIDTVVEETIKRTGKNPYETPMKIYTTMNKDLQEKMAKIMKGETFKWENEVIQGASIVLNVHNGEIQAVGAGRNRVVRGNNFATNLNNQIGSTAKPLFDYAPAIEYNNFSTYTPITDEPYAYSDGTNLRNWDYKYEGYVTLHEALKHSRNVPALKTFQSVGSTKIKQFTTNLGLSHDDYFHEAHSIGGYNGESPMTLAAAYAAFSNGGYYIEPHSFTKIEFTETNEIYEVKPITRRAMSESTAYMITKILEDTQSYAIGRYINGVNFAGKTGTTNLDKAIIDKLGLPRNAISDKWIASFNDTYALTVWYGYERLSKEHVLTLSNQGVRDLFQTIARKVYTKNSHWEQPSSVVGMEVEYGLPEAMLPSPYTPKDQKVFAYFKRGFEPTGVSKRYSQLDNVKNINYKDNKLSWDAIPTPQFIDENYLKQMFNKLFTSDEYKTSELNKRLEYNKNNIGDIVYNVYEKDKDGNLKLLTTTTNTEFEYPILKTTEFVVKTSYSIFKDNMSTGTEIKIEKEIVPIINSILNSKSTINVKLNEEYKEPKKPVIVTENLIEDVTDKATITISILRNSDNKTFTDIKDIKTDKKETYTITYHIKYGSYNETLLKIVQVK